MTSAKSNKLWLPLLNYLMGIEARGRHRIEPRPLLFMHRYQCDAMNCKKFIRYDERTGTWHHLEPRG